ncbi:hypothetical protein CPAR01_10720 [Colletotrichum paranaense]|uniref:Uncharacterized protein n=1 Tax=Colletotrichum paranaense TaxID=1914294 RepID=A0ABQ9SET5_9PEZI|nr:uncharacterized protein CPAR01_10720 [Colletotrichum paranaense]KAK1534012.1 hypothetical protein CPAR01_10720 [Colletotrichum paranaense]
MVQTLGHFSPAAPYGPDGAYWGLPKCEARPTTFALSDVACLPYHGQIGGLLFTR